MQVLPSPVFHNDTAQLLQRLRKSPPQSLLITGERGLGLLYAARYITEQPYILHALDSKGERDELRGSIRVDMIRSIYDITRSKSKKRQCIIIDNAELMTTAAQNAFLKLLEEPPENVYFILTSHQPQRLLATVRSRVQKITIQPPSSSQTRQLIASLHVTDQMRVSQLLFIADQRPAEIVRLVENEEYFERVASAMAHARTMVAGAKYDRIVLIQGYNNDRAAAQLLIKSILTILHRQLLKSPSADIIDRARRYTEAYDRIDGNASVRLQLLNCAII